MNRLTIKQNIAFKVAIILICTILLVPLANKEFVFNLFIPSMNLQWADGKGGRLTIEWIRLGLFLIIIYEFFNLRNCLMPYDSKWRRNLYTVVVFWLFLNISGGIGDKIMSFRKGLKVIEFKFDKSKINYSVDSLGIMHAKGELTFRNYSSDTVTFKCIFYNEDFFFSYPHSSDLKLPDTVYPKSGEGIKITPKSTYTLNIEFDSKLTGQILSKTNPISGTVSTLKKITIFSENEIRTFEL